MENKEISEQLSFVILKQLKNLNMSQSYLSKEIGVSQPMINYYIQGKHTPKIDVLIKLCKVLNLSFCTDNGFNFKNQQNQ